MYSKFVLAIRFCSAEMAISVGKWPMADYYFKLWYVHLVYIYIYIFMVAPPLGGFSEPCSAPSGRFTKFLAVPVGEIYPFIQLGGLEQ